MAVNQTFPFYQLNLDIQHVRRLFRIITHCGTTPSIRCYLYEGGSQFIPEQDFTCTLAFGTDFDDSTELTEVTGQIAAVSATDDYNYVQFDFTGADTATAGDYFCQVMLSNSDDTKSWVFGRGTLHLLKSPISGSYTPTTLTSTVNWSVITNTGTLPWPDEFSAISDLTAVSNVASGDLFEFSQDQGAGVYTSKSITYANLLAKIQTDLGL